MEWHTEERGFAQCLTLKREEVPTLLGSQHQPNLIGNPNRKHVSS